MLARNLTCKEVSCVNLYARLVCILLKKDSCLRRVNAYSKLVDVAGCVENPVVVVSVTENELLVVSVDVLSDRLRSAEIKRSTLYRTHFAGRDELVVCRSESICVHIKNHVRSLFSMLS